MYYSQQKKKGATLMEILLVIVIMAILLVLGLSSLADYKNKHDLGNTVEAIFSHLNQARTLTLSSKGESVYGVHFESNRIVSFKGATFSEPNSDNEEYALSSSVTIENITLNGGGDDVVFDRLTGLTNHYGTMDVSLTNGSASSTITIYASGSFDIN